MNATSFLSALLPMLFFVGIFALSMHKDRSRYRNIVLLLLAALAVLSFLLYLISCLSGTAASWTSLVLFVLLLLLFLALPLFLIANGVQMIRKEGKSLANLLSLLLGLVLLAGELSAGLWGIGLCLSLGEGTDGMGILARLSPVFLLLMATAFYLSVTFLSFLVYCLFLQLIPVKRDFDYVIIHGAGLKKDGTVTKLLAERCDKAVEIYRRDPTPPYLVPSGGQGADEARSEAAAMEAYLIQQGIPREKILKEDKSATTMENIQNSKALIDQRPGRKYTALVTSNYHVYRAMRYARKAGLSAVGIGAHVASYYFPSALIREFIAVHREKKHLILFLVGYFIVLLPVLLVMFETF